MKNIVKVGLVQMRCVADSKNNLNRAGVSIKKLAKKGAEIICLPELFLSEYFCQERNKKYFEYAEPVPGDSTRALAALARSNHVTLITSVYERAEVFRGASKVKLYNTAVVLGANGKLLGKYRKIRIPDDKENNYDEAFYFEKGDLGVRVMKAPRASIAPMICYDQWFPENARAAAKKGAQILFYSTAIGWPFFARPSLKLRRATKDTAFKQRAELNKAENEAWQIIQRSHAIANNVFVVSVNRVGLDNKLNFWGNSFACDPFGRILAQAPNNREADLIAELDLDLINAVRKDWPFFTSFR